MIKSLKQRKQKGFTLIEIMAVIAIIAILAAVLVPKVLGYFKEAKKTQVIDQARKVVIAAENWGMKKDKVGSALDGITVAKLESDVDDDMLSIDDITKLNYTGLKVGHCRSIIDTKNYNFEVESDGTLKALPTAVTEEEE